MEDYRATAVAKLAASSLGREDAERLGLQLVSDNELKQAGLPAGTAIEIPYFTISGEKNCFARYRYLTDTRTSFEKIGGKKQIRYLQPSNTRAPAYFPPYMDWAAIAEDTGKDVCITEGEFKAACASKLGFTCLGLGGVWSFKSKRDHVNLITDLEQIRWNGRNVIVIFDSDAKNNPQVLAARNFLCRELSRRGAHVFVAHLPDNAQGARQGLDDFILEEGIEAFRALLESEEGTTPYVENVALHDLNERVVYVRDPGFVVEVGTGQRIRPDAFCGHAYSNMMQQVKTKKGVKERSLPRMWLNWPHRAESRSVIYRPGDARFTGDGHYNMWSGWGCEPRPGDVSPWHQLLDHIFKDAPMERQWFERWLALPLQRPGTKMYTAAVLWSVTHGAGKSIIGETMARIYGNNYTMINDDHLDAAFNAWAENRQFIMGDDMSGHNNRRNTNKLKSLITNEEIWLNLKFIPQYKLIDCINYLFNSNQPDVFFIEEEDRRFFVHEITAGILPESVWLPYREWMRGDGPAFLFDYLLNLDLGGMRPQDRAPMTGAKQDMINNSASDLARWIQILKMEPEQVLRVGMALSVGDLWSADDLLEIFSRTHPSALKVNGVGRELKKARVPIAYDGRSVRTAVGSKALYIVRNSGKWLEATHQQLVEHYNKTRVMHLTRS